MQRQEVSLSSYQCSRGILSIQVSSDSSNMDAYCLAVFHLLTPTLLLAHFPACACII